MIFNTLAVDADNEWIMIDSTIVRAHQHAAGALKKYRNGGMQEQGRGRSKGGLRSKLHAACDALGNPMRFFVTAGQRSDDIKALDLIDGQTMSALIADKGYDANHIVIVFSHIVSRLSPTSF